MAVGVVRANPCLVHGCHSCCINNEMPLRDSDIARLESLGYRREDFVRVVDGVRVLATREDGSCFFLGDDGLCSVYESRPEGCRLYPLVWHVDGGRAVLDADCPYRHEFSFGPDAVARLMDLVREIYGEEVLKGRAAHRRRRCRASGR
ncbi:MAG: YkgJ family cysteine cluster protein [Conexivisphaera sp.]